MELVRQREGAIFLQSARALGGDEFPTAAESASGGAYRNDNVASMDRTKSLAIVRLPKI
jgi:hypothetical protein